MSIFWTRTSVGSFVWNLTRSLLNFTALFELPVTRFVGAKPSPGDPRATAADVAMTATATIAALNFFQCLRAVSIRCPPILGRSPASRRPRAGFHRNEKAGLTFLATIRAAHPPDG